MKRSRTKFNVSTKVERRTCDGVVFDSELECKYYRNVVKPKLASGEIVFYELQKPYLLQERFVRRGKTYQPIKYIADFYLEYADGHTEVIDTKGMADNMAMLKRKMMFYLYPDVNLIWMSYCATYGGWIEYDELKKIRRNKKRMKKMEEKEDGK